VPPQGRIDVFLYRMAERGLEQFEREHGLIGYRDRILPIVEQLLLQYMPAHNVLPREFVNLLELAQLHQVRKGPGMAGGAGR
jgi:hypothetical protein